jgi:hypothetical protein
MAAMNSRVAFALGTRGNLFHLRQQIEPVGSSGDDLDHNSPQFFLARIAQTVEIGAWEVAAGDDAAYRVHVCSRPIATFGRLGYFIAHRWGLSRWALSGRRANAESLAPR